MTTPASPPEPDGRRERSRRSREAVVAAATELFLEQDYVTTTMGAVAERASVSEQSVYYLFGTKCGLLAAVLAATVRGDGEPVPVLDQPWVEGLADVTEGTSAVERMVAASVEIVARTAGIYGVVQRASADPDVRELLEDTRRRRRSDQRRLIDVVADAGHLRRGADLSAAADVFYGLVNEEVYSLLTVDCGWSHERFSSWVTATMENELAVM